jgi:hypothetical protein
MVKKGSVSMLWSTYVPASSSSPIALVRARNMPPLVSLIAIIIANVDNPKISPPRKLAME